MISILFVKLFKYRRYALKHVYFVAVDCMERKDQSSNVANSRTSGRRPLSHRPGWPHFGSLNWTVKKFLLN